MNQGMTHDERQSPLSARVRQRRDGYSSTSSHSAQPLASAPSSGDHQPSGLRASIEYSTTEAFSVQDAPERNQRREEFDYSALPDGGADGNEARLRDHERQTSTENRSTADIEVAGRSDIRSTADDAASGGSITDVFAQDEQRLSDIRDARAAINKRWDIDEDLKQAIIGRMSLLIVDDTKKTREHIAAAKLVLAAERQNQGDEHKLTPDVLLTAHATKPIPTNERRTASTSAILAELERRKHRTVDPASRQLPEHDRVDANTTDASTGDTDSTNTPTTTDTRIAELAERTDGGRLATDRPDVQRLGE